MIYKPKPGGLNKNAHMYTEEQMKYAKQELEEVAHYFGYNKVEGNPYGFLDYEGKSSPEI